jgi:hypothetical protein
MKEDYYMAKVKQNALVEGLSGTIGKNLVFRHMKDGRTIVSTKQDFSNRVFSKGQLTHQSRFQQAAAYARDAAKSNPIYFELAKGTTKTAYNIALSDWFNPPMIHGVQRTNTLIQIDATDNVLVVRVRVSILDEGGKVLEQGEAASQNAELWKYTCSASGRIRVEVWDLAGNVVRKET